MQISEQECLGKGHHQATCMYSPSSVCIEKTLLILTASAAVNIANYVRKLGQIAQSEIFIGVIVKWRFQ